MKLSLHLGAHKTASTHVQAMLAENASLIARAGIGVLLPDALRAAGRRAENGFGLTGETAAACWAELTQMAGGAEQLLITEENLLGRKLPAVGAPPQLYPDAARRIAPILQRLDAHNVTVLLGLRDPSAWMASVYRQHLSAGRVQDFATFCAGHSPAELRWSEVLGRLADMPGIGRVIYWRYEDYSVLSRKVFGALLGDQLGSAMELSDRDVHPGLSAAAVEAILTGQGEGSTDQRAAAAKAAFPLAEGHAPYRPWSDRERANSAASYALDLGHMAAEGRFDRLRPRAHPTVA